MFFLIFKVNAFRSGELDLDVVNSHLLDYTNPADGRTVFTGRFKSLYEGDPLFVSDLPS